MERLSPRRLETGVSEVLRRLKVNKFGDQYANAADDSTPAQMMMREIGAAAAGGEARV
jgi:hypothetical protein